jgi:hypothetical protein
MPERRIEPLEFNGETVYIEVVEDAHDPLTGAGEWEETNAAQRLAEAGERVRTTLSALATTVRDALNQAEPEEWTLEIHLGFKANGGIPFITEGKVNGAVKVIATWKKGGGDGHPG